MKKYFWWRTKNKFRRVFGYAAVPKNCCRDVSNLGPVVEEAGLAYRRCVKCQCRHFELRADPGKFGIVLALRSST